METIVSNNSSVSIKRSWKPIIICFLLFFLFSVITILLLNYGPSLLSVQKSNNSIKQSAANIFPPIDQKIINLFESGTAQDLENYVSTPKKYQDFPEDAMYLAILLRIQEKNYLKAADDARYLKSIFNKDYIYFSLGGCDDSFDFDKDKSTLTFLLDKKYEVIPLEEMNAKQLKQMAETHIALDVAYPPGYEDSLYQLGAFTAASNYDLKTLRGMPLKISQAINTPNSSTDYIKSLLALTDDDFQRCPTALMKKRINELAAYESSGNNDAVLSSFLFSQAGQLSQVKEISGNLKATKVLYFILGFGVWLFFSLFIALILIRSNKNYIAALFIILIGLGNLYFANDFSLNARYMELAAIGYILYPPLIAAAFWFLLGVLKLFSRIMPVNSSKFFGSWKFMFVLLILFPIYSFLVFSIASDYLSIVNYLRVPIFNF